MKDMLKSQTDGRRRGILRSDMADAPWARKYNPECRNAEHLACALGVYMDAAVSYT